MNAITDITAAPADELPTEVPARAAAGMALALAGPASDLVPPLPDLLAERNALVDRANEAAAADDDKTADSLSAQLARVESAIDASTCASIDDAIAKLALVAQHNREGLCFEVERLEVLHAEIGRILGAAAYPATALPSPRPGRWAFLPADNLQTEPKKYKSYADRSPTAALQAIVAAARDHAVKVMDPAIKAHSDAERAYFAAPEDQRTDEQDAEIDRLDLAQSAAGDAYKEIVDLILTLKAGSPADVISQVHAYADLMTTYYGHNIYSEPPGMRRLTPDCRLELFDHVLAQLERMVDDRPSIAISALAGQMESRWADERAVYAGDHDDAAAEAAVERTGAAAHQLMALPATSLADFRAKARAVEWAVSGDWSDFGDGSTSHDFAASILRELIDGQPVPPTPLKVVTAWGEAFAKVEAAARAFHDAVKAETAITDAVEIACPPPEALLSNAHEQPFRAKRYHLTEASIEALKIPLAQKFEMSRLLTAYDDATDAEEQRLGLQAAVDARDAAFDAWREAHTALVAMPSPTVDALTQKAWAMILDDCFNEEMGEPTPARLGKLLIADGGDYVAVKIYQDLVRLSGGPAEIANYGGFDPTAWLAEFKSKPGVSFDSDLGAPFYDDLLAWEEPQLALHRDFVIEDPDATRRYHASFAGTPEGDAHLAERRAKDPEFDTRPFIASEPFHFTRLFEADDPRLEEWNGRHARLNAQFKARKSGASKPTHAHLWNELADWQKESVRNVARAQKAAS